MIAELKEISSIETNIPLEKYVPKDINYFSLDLDLVIGIKGKEGGDYFSITVTSLQYLNMQNITNYKEFQRGLFIIDVYDYKVIKNKLNTFISNYLGNNWEVITKDLSEIFIWEFENYQNS